MIFVWYRNRVSVFLATYLGILVLQLVSGASQKKLDNGELPYYYYSMHKWKQQVGSKAIIIVCKSPYVKEEHFV